MVVHAVGFEDVSGIGQCLVLEWIEGKPANIMIRDAGGEVVITDFGLADTDDYIELKQSAGTQGFISPEQLERGGANTSDDVYSHYFLMSYIMGISGRECMFADGNME